MGSKLLVTLGFVLLLHFIQRFEDERTRRLKHPVTLGATEALKVLLINPHQRAWHSRSIRLAMSKTEQYPEAGTCLKSERKYPMPQNVDGSGVQD